MLGGSTYHYHAEVQASKSKGLGTNGMAARTFNVHLGQNIRVHETSCNGLQVREQGGCACSAAVAADAFAAPLRAVRNARTEFSQRSVARGLMGAVTKDGGRGAQLAADVAEANPALQELFAMYNSAPASNEEEQKKKEEVSPLFKVFNMVRIASSRQSRQGLHLPPDRQPPAKGHPRMRRAAGVRRGRPAPPRPP
jgi:hypothetical protein